MNAKIEHRSSTTTAWKYQRRERINKIIKSIKILRFFLVGILLYDDAKREGERVREILGVYRAVCWFAVCCCWFAAFIWFWVRFHAAFFAPSIARQICCGFGFFVCYFSPSLLLARSLAVVFSSQTCVTRIALPEFFLDLFFHLFFWLVWSAITNISEIESISINRSHRFQINNSGDIHIHFFCVHNSFFFVVADPVCSCVCIFCWIHFYCVDNWWIPMHATKITLQNMCVVCLTPSSLHYLCYSPSIRFALYACVHQNGLLFYLFAHTLLNLANCHGALIYCGEMA